MPKSKFSEAQIVAALRQVEAGRAAAEVAREVGVTCLASAVQASA
jgi:hypothetical protein